MTLPELIETLADGINETFPVATDEDIAISERALRATLPESFKTFVKTFSNGGNLLMLQDVNSVGERNKAILPIHKLFIGAGKSDSRIPFADEDAEGDIAFHELLPFSLDSNGNAWCFLKADPSDPEPPVAYYEMLSRKLYGKLDGGFLEWLDTLVDTQSQVIRVLYDEDFLSDVLNLEDPDQPIRPRRQKK